jgi:SAM-dependent methyltransferase
VTCAYTCNVCGRANAAPEVEDGRRLCAGCGASLRFRAIAHVVTTRVFGSAQPLYALEGRWPLRGFGLSDFHGYASRLRALCDYRNTFFHTEPRIDICDPPAEETAANDFVIASDVFEHTPPPAARPFAGAARVLRPGGMLVLSVPVNPHTSQTLEHYPRLHEFSVEREGEGPDDYVVVNRLAAGGVERYLHPRFHGGPGQTLEMRIFSEQHVAELLRRHGFSAPERVLEERPEYGIADFGRISAVFVATRLPAGSPP